MSSTVEPRIEGKVKRQTGWGKPAEISMSGKAIPYQKGLLKLMLRMPALRGQLQVLSAHNYELQSLCEAFEETQTMIENLRSKPDGKNVGELEEYERLRTEIENDVIWICQRK